jgi:hypothetical protein
MKGKPGHLLLLYEGSEKSHHLSGIGLHTFLSESATLPQLKQMNCGFFVMHLMSSNFPPLARTQMCPWWFPLQTVSAIADLLL